MKKYILMAALCAMACTACHKKASVAEEHHHETYALMTAYSDNYEIYAESDPLAAGNEATVLAHVTTLSDFKPLAEGPASAVLTVGGQQASGSADSPSTPGIFKIALKPTTAGEGTIKISVGGEEFSAPVTVYSSEEEAEEAGEAAEIKSSNAVSFSKEKSWMVDFATAQCVREPFGQVIKTVGQVLQDQGQEQVVTAKASGIVTITGGSVLPGSSVRAGQQLFSIKSSGIDDASISVRYSQAKSEYERAKGEYDRKVKLAADKIVSESELSQAKAEYETAKAVYENLSGSYKGGSISATSGISGYVTDVYVSNGQYVETGQPLAAVSSSNRVMIQARVQPKWHRDLAGISDANFKTADGSVYSLKELGGKVASVAKSTTSDSPLLPVTFEVANKADFVPGTFVDVFIKTVNSSDAVTVPCEAVVEEMGNYFVYKQLTPELFEKTQVTIGATDGARTEIKSGLSGDERIVSKGAVLVKLAQAAGGLDAHAGHVH